jgi:hypothetical protein
MALEIEVGRITAIDNQNGKVIQGRVTFKDYEIRHDEIVVDVSIPLDKELSLASIEAQVLAKAKQQLKDLVASF